MIEFNVKRSERFDLIEFRISGILEPGDLFGLTVPHVEPGRGVVISGRGPIWLYGYLGHKYHYAPWVAFYDPRLEGAVVVQSHRRGVLEGDLVKVEVEHVG